MMKKNLRYLKNTLAATAFLASASSYALGIGDMTLQSSLNQNLKADISLILSSGEKPADLKIGLAPITKFDEAGIPWTVFLSKIEFKIVTEQGRTFIKLSSKEVLKEPFLDFILEIRGAKSSLYREFTVLVDPPEAYQAVEKSIPKKENVPTRLISAPIEKTKVAINKPKTISAKPKTILKPTLVHQKLSKPISPAPEINQKMVELEKQLSEMKQALAKQNAQIAALKIPVTPAVAPTVVNNVAPTTPIATVVEPPIPTTLPIVSPVLEPPILVSTPIAPVPQVLESKPAIQPPSTTAPDLVTKIVDSISTIYLSIPVESYNYVAAATASLLVGLLGVLRFRNRKNTVQDENENRIEPDVVITDEKSENIIQPSLEKSFDKMFSDEMPLELQHTELKQFETQALSEFSTLIDEDENKYNANDVLYRVDVYCAYGNFDHAILLLNNEFSKHPDVNDYAIRLLNLYVSQNKKEEFKAFISILMAKGKHENAAFWQNVSDITTVFCPEALMIEKTVEIKSSHDSSNYELRFDEIDDKDIFSEFNQKNSPEIPFESEFNLDFTHFEIEKEAVMEEPEFVLDSEFNLDFTTFNIEKDVEIKKSEFLSESEMGLDFSLFDLEEDAALENVANSRKISA